MNLLRYIKHVKKLEAQRYALEKIINDMDYRASNLCVPKQISCPETTSASSAGISGFIFVAIIVVFSILAFNMPNCVGGGSPKISCINDAASCVGSFFTMVGLAGIIIAIICTVKTIQEINNAKEEAEKLQGEYAFSLTAEKNRLEQEEILKNNYIIAIEILSDTYWKIVATLNSLYSTDTIYKKYQGDLVAICMFEEYLESGMCSKLTGHEGAYILYENQVRLDLILSKLDDVIKKLDDIIENQHNLYNTMRSIERNQHSIINSLQKLNKKIDTSNKNLECIRYNTEVLKTNDNIRMIYGI